MSVMTTHIDPYLFELQFAAFKSYVEEKSGLGFTSFASNTYTDTQEGYKDYIYRAAREALSFDSWRDADIGTGKIAKAVIAAIEIPENNLVPWQAKYGPRNQPHRPLHLSVDDAYGLKVVEKLFFEFYRGSDDQTFFVKLVDTFGKKYPLIAYFFFLKDKSRYLPIAPRYFDEAFTILGAEYVTSYRCSWDNYTGYLSLISELKSHLAEVLQTEICLLDAHSFAFILAAEMSREKWLANVQEYSCLTETEREAICRARIGQGQFRQRLIDYWSVCAVTGCSELKLLIASHIKPWKGSNCADRLNLFNGLLLHAGIDACFDQGFIAFDDGGSMLISPKLSKNDVTALGLHINMKLSHVDEAHKPFLEHHRKIHASNFI